MDRYEKVKIDARITQGSRDLPRTEWRFDGEVDDGVPPDAAANRGWRGGTGVAELTMQNGNLTGRTTTVFPILHVERTTGLEDKDLLHEVEIRVRVSAGANLAISFQNSEVVDIERVLELERAFPWLIRTPLLPGDQFRTYILQPPFPVDSSAIRHVLVRPTDAVGARFEIESIRLVFRREHLARIPSGIGWHALSGIYRETIVSRFPETSSIHLKLTKRPRLDLYIGTLEEGPITFQVAVARNTQSGKIGEAERIIFNQTVTTPHRWEPARVDLTRFANEEVTLSLSLEAAEKGALGFWGSAVVRNPGVPPPTRAAGTGEPPQGVILVWVDTLRRDHLDVYGYGRETAPNIRRMAGEGTRFSRSIVNATWTKVSTPSLLTSLYPSSHGVINFSDRLPASAITLAEVYRESGYATLSLSSYAFTGKFTNLHQGFEVVHEGSSLPEGLKSKTARVYIDRLLPWIEAHREVPFFAFVHITDPHDPFDPYPPYDSLWGDPSRREEHERQQKMVREFIQDPLLQQFGMPTRTELERANIDVGEYLSREIEGYDGSIRGLDAEIGRLIERLKSLGIAEKTLVVFTSDHGEEFLEHGRMFHGQSLYGELTNVPLIFWQPGSIPGGRVVDTTVQVIDLMPTLLEMSRLPHPAGMQGRSLMPFLSDSPPSGGSDPPVFAEKNVTDENNAGPPPRYTESFAVLHDGWRLVHHTRRTREEAGQGEFELYDEKLDPLNQKDLAARHPEIVSRLTARLEEWRTVVQEARLAPDSETTQALSAEELEQLRSLGYLE
ncbi:MAG: sulfatase [Acidobacteriota bacterium]